MMCSERTSFTSADANICSDKTATIAGNTRPMATPHSKALFTAETQRRREKQSRLLCASASLRLISSQNSFNDVPTHIRQPKIPSRMPECQPLVIETQQMQNGCMKIMNVHFILDHPCPVFVALAIRDAPLYAASGDPR